MLRPVTGDSANPSIPFFPDSFDGEAAAGLALSGEVVPDDGLVVGLAALAVPPGVLGEVDVCAQSGAFGLVGFVAVAGFVSAVSEAGAFGVADG